MSNELYFLPILIDAFQQPNQQEALLQAYQKIQKKGKQDGYHEGFAQFEAFMNQAEQASIEASLAEMDQEYNLASDATSTLLLLCDDQPLGSFHVGQQSSTTTFDRIQPGLYQLRTETGWVIWEEVLNEDDLLWSLSFPNQPLMLAADTDDSQKYESKSFQLLDDAMLINIYPGPEFSSLAIQYNATGMGE